ncbi:hypothetical protein VTJ49DRAFT_3066 [Mycothermus thermophilus]|uniref:Four helix bundle protein n=1 Tax=Humicola insolens TaxID=85995 RepID=A0ABR3VMK0_HUMIN
MPDISSDLRRSVALQVNFRDIVETAIGLHQYREFRSRQPLVEAAFEVIESGIRCKFQLERNEVSVRVAKEELKTCRSSLTNLMSQLSVFLDGRDKEEVLEKRRKIWIRI